VTAAFLLLALAVQGGGALRDEPRDEPGAAPRVQSASRFEIELRNLERRYPELVELRSLGSSAGGRELWLAQVAASGESAPNARPALLIADVAPDGVPFGGDVALSILGQLVERSTEPEVAELFARCVLYVAPALNPDARARYLRAESRDAAEPAAPAFEHNFPRGWMPAVVQPGAGPYPLYLPEVEAVVEFLHGHDNLCMVQVFRPRPFAAEELDADGPAFERWEPSGDERGGFLPWCAVDRGLDAVVVGYPDTAGDATAVNAVLDGCAELVLELLAALPRLELEPVAVERIGEGQWRVDVAIENAGARPTAPRREPRPASAAVRVRVRGAELRGAGRRGPGEEGFGFVPAGEELAVGHLGPGEACVLRLLLDAPAGTRVERDAFAPRAGWAYLRVALGDGGE